jgi:hypothetical protein
MVARGDVADKQTLAELNARYEQTTIDLDWYRNTGVQLRLDADKQKATIATIRAELAGRTTTPHTPQTRPQRRPEPTLRHDATAIAVAQEQIISQLPKPPQDTPGA